MRVCIYICIHIHGLLVEGLVGFTCIHGGCQRYADIIWDDVGFPSASLHCAASRLSTGSCDYGSGARAGSLMSIQVQVQICIYIYNMYIQLYTHMNVFL